MNARLSQCVLAIAFIALAALALPAGGSMLFNVDLNGGTDFDGDGTGPTYTGPGVLSLSPTDQWNGIDAPPNQANIPLNDSTGAATAVTLTTSGFEYATTYLGASAFTATPYNDLMEDFFGMFTNPGPITLTFHNLPANQNGEFVLYGQAQVGAPSSGLATISATALNWANDGSPSTFIEGVNYVDFESILTDGSGDLVVTITQPGIETDINGFQLLVPEPASLTLLMGGGLLFLRRRRT